jgi:hypothetical protein
VGRAISILAGGTATLAAVLALSACGDNPDNRYGAFTDCADIGPVATATDPKGDQAGRLAGKAAQPQGDLLGLRVARGGGKLCAEFRVATKVRPPAAYVLALRPRDSETPLVQLEATVLAAQNPEALLQARAGAEFRQLPGKVGIRGDRLSIVVDREPFAAQGLGAVFDAFRFQARAAAVTSDGGRQTDCLPDCT